MTRDANSLTAARYIAGMADYLWILPIALLALLMKGGSNADGSGGDGWLPGDWFGGSDCDAGDGGGCGGD